MKTRGLSPLCAGLLALSAASRPVYALIGETPTIRAISVRALDPARTKVVMLTMDRGGNHFLQVRVIDKATGKLEGAELVVPIPAGVTPVDVLSSSAMSPGNVLLLDSQARVHLYVLAFDADGSPKLPGSPMILFDPPQGIDLELTGAATALAEAPNVFDRKLPWLAIGTANGHVIVTDIAVVEARPLAEGPIDDLGAVPQVGLFAFAAVSQGKLVGFDPDGDSAQPGPQVQTIFGLADPRPDPLIDFAGLVFEPDDQPLTSAQPVSVVAASGTTTVQVLTIPADPGLDGILQPEQDIIVDGCPIAQVEHGSLAMLPAEGLGLYYDPGFTIAGGSSGQMLTIAGATMRLNPRSLNRASKGNYVTAVIEVADDAAAQIDPGTLALRFGTASVAVASSFTPRLGDTDGDGLADLTAKFDRAAVCAMLGGVPAGPVSLQASWAYTDESTGSASAQIKITK